MAELFEANKIAFFRIHGSLPSGKRAKVLADFEKSASIKVLLITFGTGGVGYVYTTVYKCVLQLKDHRINKLMSANQIHILEPQWNPSIESQAIGRILRFGQERCVRIVRYIMKQTVEEVTSRKSLHRFSLIETRPYSPSSCENCSLHTVDLPFRPTVSWQALLRFHWLPYLTQLEPNLPG